MIFWSFCQAEIYKTLFINIWINKESADILAKDLIILHC